jgi:hypothetical protein
VAAHRGREHRAAKPLKRQRKFSGPLRPTHAPFMFMFVSAKKERMENQKIA